MKTIAVLGGGGTGCTIAADNILRGNTVRLWEDEQQWNKNLAGVQENGGIHITGNAITGFAKDIKLCKNMVEALEGAQIILIAALASRHEAIFKELAPLLRPGQTVCVSAGCGSVILLRNLLGDKQNIITGEMSGNVYPCRMDGKAKVIVALPYKVKNAAAFPAKDTDKFICELKDVYECKAVKNILESALNAPNLSIHLAASLLNVCAIDKNPDFRLYAEGLSENVLSIIDAVELEKLKLLTVLGYECVLHAPFMRQLVQYDSFPEFNIFRSLLGPSGMKHRYITEDAAFGQILFYSLAEHFNIVAPCTRALIHLAGVINNTDYFSLGQTIKKLGMGDMSVSQINEYLSTGVAG